MTRGWQFNKACALAVVLLAAACDTAPKEELFTAEKTEFSKLENWEVDDHTAARRAFLDSCDVLATRPRAQTEKSQIAIGADVWQKPCEAAAKTYDNPQSARLFFEHYFVPFVVGNNDDPEGLFTGYYEPQLYGSRVRRGDFRYPVYGKPNDLRDGSPYRTRQEIETSGLEGKAPVLAWVDDAVMLFFLQVQGSGRIRLMDGEDMRVGFAGRNGHPYAAIGKFLKEEELLPEDQVDFFGIRQWLYKNPDKAQAMMWRNPSYIFFEELKGPGPKGAIGAPLSAGRSLAVDKRYIPYGLPLYLVTQLPAGPGKEPTPFSRLMVAHDTGAAIKGPVRGDIFFGHGDEAEFYAGRMKSPGHYYLLVPKAIADKLN